MVTKFPVKLYRSMQMVQTKFTLGSWELFSFGIYTFLLH